GSVTRSWRIGEQDEPSTGPKYTSALVDQLGLKLVVQLVQSLLGNDDVRLPVTGRKLVFETRLDVESKGHVSVGSTLSDLDRPPCEPRPGRLLTGVSVDTKDVEAVELAEQGRHAI